MGSWSPKRWRRCHRHLVAHVLNLICVQVHSLLWPLYIGREEGGEREKERRVVVCVCVCGGGGGGGWGGG